MLKKRCSHKDRQRDDCNHPWWAVFEVRGRTYATSLEKHFKVRVRGRGSKTLATDLARKYRDRLDGQRRDPGTMTWPNYYEYYCNTYAPLAGLRSVDDRLCTFRMFGRFLDSKSVQLLGGISREHITLFLSDLATRRTPRTVRKHYAYLHHAFGWGVVEAKLLEHSPMAARMVLAQSGDGRDRRLQAGEEEAIRGHVPELLGDMMSVTLDMGFRQGTIRKTTVAMFRPTGTYGALAVPSRATKNKKPLVLPMSQRVREIWDRRILGPDGTVLAPEAHVFGDGFGNLVSRSTLRDWWMNACKASKVEGLRFHDLRAEAASRLHDRGVPLRVIQRFLGHASLTTTEKYLRLRVGALEDGVELLDAYVVRGSGTLSGTPPPADNGVPETNS